MGFMCTISASYISTVTEFASEVHLTCMGAPTERLTPAGMWSSRTVLPLDDTSSTNVGGLGLESRWPRTQTAHLKLQLADRLTVAT